MTKLTLLVLPDTFAVCRLAPDALVPDWTKGSSLVAITRTTDELSIVCNEVIVPEQQRCERGWRALQVAGPLDFALTGILAAIAAPLAEALISIFALSTFDTDYVLVRQHTLDSALQTLEKAGHTIVTTRA